VSQPEAWKLTYETPMSIPDKQRSTGLLPMGKVSGRLWYQTYDYTTRIQSEHALANWQR
jgi:hypothetical protein